MTDLHETFSFGVIDAVVLPSVDHDRCFSTSLTAILWRLAEIRNLLCAVSSIPRTYRMIQSYNIMIPHQSYLMVTCGSIQRNLVIRILMGKGMQSNRDKYKFCMSIAQRVASGQVAVTPARLHLNAQALRSNGECAAAAKIFEEAIRHDHSPSCAELADMLIHGREGIPLDYKKAFKLVYNGSHHGCSHCDGVLANLLFNGYGCQINKEWATVLAQKSFQKDRKYGQYVIGLLHDCDAEGLATNPAKAFKHYLMAAAQNYDLAQNKIACMYHYGFVVEKDYTKALRFFKLAANQGHPVSIYWIGMYYEYGIGIVSNIAKAIRWYKRAEAAGDTNASNALMRLNM